MGICDPNVERVIELENKLNNTLTYIEFLEKNERRLESKIDGLNSQIIDLESKIDNLECQLERADEIAAEDDI